MKLKTKSPKPQHQSFLRPNLSIKNTFEEAQFSSQTMATPKKATPPKKTKETKKPSAKISKPSSTQKKEDNKTKKKTSNGTAAAAKSPTSKSHKSRAQNGAKTTKPPTPKSKQNGKRVKEEEVDEKEAVKSYTFPMERVKRIIREDDSDLRISSDAVFLINKATVMLRLFVLELGSLSFVLFWVVLL